MSNIKKELSPEVANQMLQNVFEVCNVQPNNVPLEDLESYSNYRKDKFMVRKVLVLVIMFLFLLIPLLFWAPDIVSLKQAPTEKPSFVMNTRSLLPITSVVAQIDGKNVPVYEKSKGVYSIEPDSDGEMLITVKAANHQYIQKKIIVSNLDETAPKYVKSDAVDGKIYLYLSDDITGVDYDSIYAELEDGTKVDPLSYSENDDCVVFAKSGSKMIVYASDKAGNTLQLLLTI